MKRFLLALLLALIAGCGGDPDVDEGLAPPASSVVSGDAVIVVPLPDAHPVVLFLTKVAEANGSPVDDPKPGDVTVVPESDLAQGGDGVRTGPFVFGLVSPAFYVVTGIVDVDENFDPLVQGLNGPTATDLLGGYADVVTGDLITIDVGPDQVVGEVTVMFAAAPPDS